MVSKNTRQVNVLLLAAALMLMLVAGAFGQSRIVGIGDIHGAYPELVSILQKTGLADANRNWIGGPAVLVQTGDVLDRGAQVRDCLDLLMKLERQAEKAGGKIVPLFGNHETINVMKDTRYVTADIYRTFSSSKSEEKRGKAYREYASFMTEHKDHRHASTFTDDAAAREKWYTAHPPGYFEYQDALGPGGKYGEWIRKHRTIAKIGDGLFVHGGLNPALEFRDIEQLNSRIAAELALFDSLWKSLVRSKIIWRYMTLQEAMQYAAEELNWMQAQPKEANPEILPQIRQLLGLDNWLVLSSEGPLWYRGLANGKEEELRSKLTEMLTRLNSKYLVAGHTVVSRSEVTARFDNSVFLIDVGMLSKVYGGRAAALEIKNGKFTAYYADREPAALGR